MEVSPITPARQAAPARRRSTILRASVGTDVGPDLVSARQRYMEAIHIPAAVAVMEEDEPRLAVHNRAFDRILRRQMEEGSLAGLIRALRMFMRSSRERHATAWQQPGVGGRHFRIHLSRLPASGVHDVRVMVSLVDRTAEVETERSLRAEMLHDSLTGLPNRLAFNEAVEAAIAGSTRCESFAVVALDLTRFSRVNECIGGLAGDELIITVARRLRSALRDGDLLARLAGDEFGVLIALEEGAEEAVAAARRLQATLTQPVRLSDLEIRIDCAIGIAVRGDTMLTAHELLRNAQVALKHAKRTAAIELHRPSEVTRVRRRFSIETELRRAIENERLTLAFQPLVDLASDRVTGFEALARWQHPEHGAVSPTEFIAVAEESGLIVPLGRWALDAAARTLAAWDREVGEILPIRLCVNVSAVQLARDAVADVLAAAMRTHGIAGERLTLELTESSIVADPDRANQVLNAVHDLGARVAMDDFGTGYSSLAGLQKLPIDILKIDRTFVSAMHEDRDSVAIIRAILSLAQALGMSTVAEGIENVEAARMLGALGCTTGQGYLYAPPLPPEAALAYLRARLR